MKNKAVIKNVIYSVSSSLLMNGIIQFLIYPIISRICGSANYGNMIYIISVLSIIAAGTGGAANYTRMIAKNFNDKPNGDFNLFVLYCMPIVIFLSFIFTGQFDVVHKILIVLLTLLTVVRYYADVSFKISLEYGKYFLYYFFLTVGYLFGMVFLKFTDFWELVFITGELCAIIFAVFKGCIFKKPVFKKSEFYKENTKASRKILVSETLSAVALHFDKIVLKLLLNADAVSIFYTATLVGKMTAMLTGPLGSVLVGYLARYKSKINVKIFVLMEFIMLALSVLGTILCYAGSYVFIKISYPDFFELTKQYFLIGNAAQVLYFVDNLGMIIIMFFSNEKYQVYINSVYIILLIAAAFIFIPIYGTMGMAIGMLCVNLLKFIAVFVLGIIFIRMYSKKISFENSENS